MGNYSTAPVPPTTTTALAEEDYISFFAGFSDSSSNIQLPAKLQLRILSYLDLQTLTSCRAINQGWLNFIDRNDRLWLRLADRLGVSVVDRENKDGISEPLSHRVRRLFIHGGWIACGMSCTMNGEDAAIDNDELVDHTTRSTAGPSVQEDNEGVGYKSPAAALKLLSIDVPRKAVPKQPRTNQVVVQTLDPINLTHHTWRVAIRLPDGGRCKVKSIVGYVQASRHDSLLALVVLQPAAGQASPGRTQMSLKSSELRQLKVPKKKAPMFSRADSDSESVDESEHFPARATGSTGNRGPPRIKDDNDPTDPMSIIFISLARHKASVEYDYEQERRTREEARIKQMNAMTRDENIKDGIIAGPDEIQETQWSQNSADRERDVEEVSHFNVPMHRINRNREDKGTCQSTRDDEGSQNERKRSPKQMSNSNMRRAINMTPAERLDKQQCLLSDEDKEDEFEDDVKDRPPSEGSSNDSHEDKEEDTDEEEEDDESDEEYRYGEGAGRDLNELLGQMKPNEVLSIISLEPEVAAKAETIPIAFIDLSSPLRHVNCDVSLESMSLHWCSNESTNGECRHRQLLLLTTRWLVLYCLSENAAHGDPAMGTDQGSTVSTLSDPDAAIEMTSLGAGSLLMEISDACSNCSQNESHAYFAVFTSEKKHPNREPGKSAGFLTAIRARHQLLQQVDSMPLEPPVFFLNQSKGSTYFAFMNDYGAEYSSSGALLQLARPIITAAGDLSLEYDPCDYSMGQAMYIRHHIDDVDKHAWFHRGEKFWYWVGGMPDGVGALLIYRIGCPQPLCIMRLADVLPQDLSQQLHRTKTLEAASTWLDIGFASADKSSQDSQVPLLLAEFPKPSLHLTLSWSFRRPRSGIVKRVRWNHRCLSYL